MIQKLFTTILFAAATTTAVAQLKVLQDGKTFLQNSNTKGAAILNVGKIPYDYNFFLKTHLLFPWEYYGNVSFQSGNVTIKCNNIVFQGGTSVELGTEQNVETK
jgi:hypothetical protein